MAIEGGEKDFEQSDLTGLAAIRREVADRFRHKPEEAFEALDRYLDDAVGKRRNVLREALLSDPETNAADSMALAELVSEALRRTCADDLEITGLAEDMRSIREAQAAQAAKDEHARDKAKQESRLQSEIQKLQDFRDNLERLGLDTIKEDAVLASLRGAK